MDLIGYLTSTKRKYFLKETPTVIAFCDVSVIKRLWVSLGRYRAFRRPLLFAIVGSWRWIRTMIYWTY